MVTSAECDTRLVQLANITFLLPHTRQFAIDRIIAMSLLMYRGNAGVIVIVEAYSRDHLQ